MLIFCENLLDFLYSYNIIDSVLIKYGKIEARLTRVGTGNRETSGA